MFISVFTDELKREVTEILPKFAEWGMEYVDFRGLIYGKGIEKLTNEELRALKSQINSLGLKPGVLQTSLCKVHLPGEARVKAEMEKLEGVIRASDILGCNLVRSFNFWQHEQTDPHCGDLALRPDELSRVMEMFQPFAKCAREAGLILGFENCGQTPDEVITVLDALNVPEWGMAWDVSNMFEILPEAQGDCVDYFTKCLRRANMLHVKCRGVLPEIDAKKVPWDRVLRGAAAVGKNLPVSIETHLPNGTPGVSPEEATHRCYSYLKKIWPSAAPADLRTALAPRQVFKRPYSDDPVNFVVVGLGMGKNRCKQLTETDGVRLYGVVDINEAKAREIGDLFRVPYSADINTFLSDPAVEVMYVVTPTGLHGKIAEQCLRAGKHVLVTKPMDANVENCRSMIRLAKEKGLLLGCDFDLHFRGQLTELKKAVDDGYFGKIKSANMILNIKRTDAYYKENGGWRGTWALDGGGALSNQGIHEVDRLLSIFGTPEAVRATIATQTFDIEAEDFGLTEWKYGDGKIIRLSSTTSYPVQTWYTRLEVFGDKGAYLLTAGGPEGEHIYWWHGGRWTEDSPYPTKKEWNQGADNFAYCLRTGEPLIVPPERGRDSRYILDLMYESAKNGEGWITVGNPEG